MFPMADYSEEIKLILNLSINENRKLKHPYVGSEHFIMALLSQKNNLLTKLMSSYGLNYKAFYDKVITLIGIGDKPTQEKMFTPLFKRVISNAIMEKRENGNRAEEMTILDLLTSLFEEGEGIALRIIYEIIGRSKAEEIHKELLNFKCNNSGVLLNLINKEKGKNSINKEGEIYMNYIYDFYTCFKKDEINHIRRAPVFKIEKDNFEKILENTVVFSEDFFEKIKEKGHEFSKQEIAIRNICLFHNYKDGTTIAALFNNKGKTTNLCVLESDVQEEISEVATRLGVFKEPFIIEVIDKTIPLIITDVVIDENIEIAKSSLNDNLIKEKDKGLDEQISRYKSLVNLNDKVKKNETVITGLDDELEKLMKSLLRIKKPNAIITGEAGVGKTALVEKFACAINNNKVPGIFRDKKIVLLNISSVVAGTKYRGEFEEKLNDIIKFLTTNKDVILFIDEFHTVIGAGGAEGAIDASNILKPALARGEIKVIGATTNDEFDKFIKQDAAFARRFNRIDVLEPTKEQVISILKGTRPSVEKVYGIIVTDKMIEEIYEESKYKNGRMPDVALDALEDFCINRYFEKEREEVK